MVALCRKEIGELNIVNWVYMCSGAYLSAQLLPLYQSLGMYHTLIYCKEIPMATFQGKNLEGQISYFKHPHTRRYCAKLD